MFDSAAGSRARLPAVEFSFNGSVSSISDEAFMDCGLSESLHYVIGNLAFAQLFKLEVDGSGNLTFGVHSSDQISVNVSFCRMSIAGIWRLWIALGARGSNNPSWQDSSVRLPVRSVKYAVHVVVRVTGQHVHKFMTVILHF
jgi:hypothetical protein